MIAKIAEKFQEKFRGAELRRLRNCVFGGGGDGRVAGGQVFRAGRGAVVQIVQGVKNRRITGHRRAPCWSFRFVEAGVRKIAATGGGTGHGPCAVALYESIGELHRSGAVFGVKFDLSLCTIAVKRYLLQFRVERVEAEVSVVGEVSLNGGAYGVFGAGNF